MSVYRKVQVEFTVEEVLEAARLLGMETHINPGGPRFYVANQQYAEALISIHGLRRNMGVNSTSTGVEFIYDSDNFPQVERIKNEAAVMKLVNAARAKGYIVKTEQVGGVTVIKKVLAQGHEVEVKVADGVLETTLVGIKGPSCKQAGAWVERLGQVLEHRQTEEYHARVRVGEQVRNG